MSFKSSKVGSDVPDGNLSGQRASCSLTKGGLRAALAAAAVCIAGASLPAFAERTVSVESIDPATREIALAFGGTAEAEEAVMIAYGDKDYGTDFAAWPCRRQLGTVAADATSATFTIPTGWAVDPGGKYFRIFTGAATALPYDSEVEYIQGTGTGGNGAMIKTAIIPLCTDKVEFEVCFTSNASQCIYCARTKTSTPDSFSGFLLSSKFRIDRANSAGSLNSVKTVSVNGTVRYRVTADYKYRSVEIDGGDFGLVNQIMVSNQTFTVGGPLALFSSYEKSSSGASWSGETRNNGGTFRLYSFKLTGEDGTVKLDLVPVVKDNVTYLYDRKSGELLGKSSGSGTFGKGGVTADALFLAASGVSDIAHFFTGPIEVTDRNLLEKTATLSFPALPAAASLYAVYSTGEDRGENDPNGWNRYAKIADLAAGATGGTYALDELAGPDYDYALLRFVITEKTDAKTACATNFDHQVSYLESTGTQYINTGVAFTRNDAWGARFRLVADDVADLPTGGYGNTAAQFILGASGRSGNDNYRSAVLCQASGFQLRSCIDNRTVDNTINLGSNGATLDDTFTAIVAHSGAANVPRSMWVHWNGKTALSSRTPGAVDTLTDNKIYAFAWNKSGTATAFSKIQLEWIKRSVSSTANLDLIPVVANGKGCLFDKVSGKLFKNSGTGDFVLGPKTQTRYGFTPLVYSDAIVFQAEAGDPILDADNCSVAASGGAVEIGWVLQSAGGATADVKATFAADGVETTNTIATAQVSGATGSATIPNLWCKGTLTVTLFAESGDRTSAPVVVTLGATGVASIPFAPVLEPDTSLKQIAASGTVGLGSGTTAAWLEYGATTAYGTKIGLPLGEGGAWTATIPFDDAMWTAGKAYVRVTASNEVTGVFGTVAWQNEASAMATFAPAARTLELTGLDEAAGTATLAFGGGAIAAQTLVVAWGDRDYGTNLNDWPYAQHAAIGTVAADATSGTFTLPAEALVSGNCYRFFLGDSIIEGAEWIQPAVEGAYVKTAFTPAVNDRAEFKFNMDARGYDGTAYRNIYAAGSGWGHSVATGVNSSGWVSNTRVGTVRYAELGKVPFSTTEDHVVKLYFGTTSGSCFTIDGKTDNAIYHEFTNGSAIDSSTYNTYNNNLSSVNTPVYIWANTTGANPSKVKLYYMKWTASNGTTLKANFIPAKVGGEYCLYDLVSKTFLRNAGAEGTSFTGGDREGYVNAISFANVQTAATGARLAGTIELTALDYGTFDATLAWPALPAASTLWVVFSGSSPGEDPGAFNLADWDECVKLGDIAAGSEGGTYNLGDPSGKKRSSMRFIIATAGSTAEDIVPLNVSRAYRFKKEGLSVFIR